MRLIVKGWAGQPSWVCYYAAPVAKTYHRADCPRGKDTVEVTHVEAQARKLIPCKLCKPTPV